MTAFQLTACAGIGRNPRAPLRKPAIVDTAAAKNSPATAIGDPHRQKRRDSAVSA